MGVEAFLISSSLEGVLAQRLVRRICEHCRSESPVATSVREKLESMSGRPLSGTFYAGKGCDECRGTGYRGRVGIFELLAITPELREMILQRRSSAELKQFAQKSMITMAQDAFQKASAGETTLEEIVRVTAGDQLE
jgi:type II secretory ATPase GspE/PulE/Tfp pilus assembly ATPase PilB-like protein